MKSLRYWPPFIVILIASALLWLSLDRASSRYGGEGTADARTRMAAAGPAPSWELTDLAGKTIRSRDFDGQVVVLNFWATWCPPCRAEIPGLVALQRKYGDQGLSVIGVSLDQVEPRHVRAFAVRNGINYPIVVGDAKIVSAFGDFRGIPATFVIDRGGRLTSAHMGFVSEEALEKEIAPLLKAKG